MGNYINNMLHFSFKFNCDILNSNILLCDMKQLSLL